MHAQLQKRPKAESVDDPCPKKKRHSGTEYTFLTKIQEPVGSEGFWRHLLVRHPLPLGEDFENKNVADIDWQSLYENDESWVDTVKNQGLENCIDVHYALRYFAALK